MSASLLPDLGYSDHTIVFGRNVWQSSDPPRMATALARIVHDGISVDEAMLSVGSGPWS